jgi:outer membrane receptor protein involved in Fe transport
MRWISTCSGLVVANLWLAIAGGLIPISGWAQQVEEIVVTARKREESLQEVPISIVAFTDKQLRERNISNAYDVAKFTPNFTMARNLGRRLDSPIIRGQFNPGRGRANASFFVDDVYLPGEFGSIATSSLDNVERVEVLRGPQAALFGRATFAGAVNYITRGIGDVWEAELNAKGGSDQDYKLSGWAGGPVIEDKLKVYVGGGIEGWDGEWRNDLREGQANTTNDQENSLDFFNGPGVWMVNTPDIAGGEAACPDGYRTYPGNADAGCPPQGGDNTKIGGESLWNATLKTEFTPTDNLEFTFKYEHAETDDDHFAQMYFQPRFDPVNGTQLARGLNCRPPVYNPDKSQTLPDGTVLDGTYIPSAGWHCGELKYRQSRAQLNIPSFGGVATCPPGNFGNCVERDADGNPILDANGNGIPTFVSEPAPFIGAETETNRYLLQGVYNYRDWEFLGRGTKGRYEEDNVRDLERSYALGPVTTGLFEGYSRDSADNHSAEFRVSSPVDARVRGILGYYYYKQEADGEQRRFNSFSNNYLFGFSRDQDEENNAIFGSLEFDLTETLSFTFDGRYAKDTLTQRTDPDDPDGCAGGGICDAEQGFYSFTPRFIADYHPTDNLNFYASLAKGNKPGDFNEAWFDSGVSTQITEAALGLECDPATAPDEITGSWYREICGDAIVKEEETWTWEIGAKTSLMDGRLTANTALFYIDWTNQGINNLQCVPIADLDNTTCEGNLGVVNAGESRIYGAEVELNFQATNYLNLGLNYGLADMKLEDYYDDGLASFTCNWWEFSQASGGLTTRPTPDCEAQGAGNAAGKQGELTPKHTANFSASYQRPFAASDMEWFVKNYLNYSSKRYMTVANVAELGDTYLWDASIGLQNDRWQVTTYVNNILDDDTPTTAFDFPLFDNSQTPSLPGLPLPFGKIQNQAGVVPSTAILVTPRRGTSYGVTMQYRFGG